MKIVGVTKDQEVRSERGTTRLRKGDILTLPAPVVEDLRNVYGTGLLLNLTPHPVSVALVREYPCRPIQKDSSAESVFCPECEGRPPSLIACPTCGGDRTIIAECSISWEQRRKQIMEARKELEVLVKSVSWKRAT